jgi:arylsulfatase A-like enzyme
MLIGKWHLGDQPEFLPTRQGFGTYWGVPYSDDMTPRAGQPWPPLPLMRDERVIEAPVDRDTLTVREAAEALRFLEAKRGGPFFLLVAHAMPGSTAAPFASPAFRGKSANGPWGDAVEELDWSVGEVLGALRRLGLEENTLVFWTSDNGAPQRNPPQGSNRPLGGAGYTVAEGGMRVPAIVRWPGRVPAGSECAELVTLMDLLPTLAGLTGGRVPPERPIDGKDIRPLLEGRPGARSPHEAFFYYTQEQLQAVRAGPWKLYLRLEERLGRSGKREPAAGAAVRLYDVASDPGETRDVAAAHPAVVAELERHAERARVELGDLGRPGRGQRPAGRVEVPRAQVLR